MRKKPQSKAVEQRAVDWISGGDVGMSSETIWSVMMGAHVRARVSVPLDPSDFGRCYRLLRLIPEWRTRLPEVAAKYSEWTGLVAAWDELTALFEQECVGDDWDAPKLYARMSEILRSESAAWKPSSAR